MRIGTKSILFGAHQFILHPLMVALAWWKLYGFPWDPRLWVAFFVHDMGYWRKPNIDGKEGERHPFCGAEFMYRFFGIEWYIFCRDHSRHLAVKCNSKPSRLCFADKLAFCITPKWLYLPMVILTGEIKEFMEGKPHQSASLWFDAVKIYMLRWIAYHKDGREDTWTKERGLFDATKV